MLTESTERAQATAATGTMTSKRSMVMMTVIHASELAEREQTPKAQYARYE